MIRAANLAQRLANILASRGKLADFARDVRCVDDSDGLPPRLEHWDAALLGPEPTQMEVDAASDGPTAEQQRNTLDESERVVCKGDVALLALVNQTRQEWRDWAATNFPSLLTAGEKNKMGDICWLLAISIRRQLR